MPQPVQRKREPWTFVLPSDRELTKEQQTVFTLRPMNAIERATVVDNYRHAVLLPSGAVETTERERQQTIGLVLSHVTTIENFPPGAPQPWPTDRAGRLRYLDQFDDRDLAAIGNEVWDNAFVMPGETRSIAEMRASKVNAASAPAPAIVDAGSGAE